MMRTLERLWGYVLCMMQKDEQNQRSKHVRLKLVCMLECKIHPSRL